MNSADAQAEVEKETEENEIDRLDEAMMESFPASDPPSSNAGVKHKEDHLTEDTSK